MNKANLHNQGMDSMREVEDGVKALGVINDKGFTTIVQTLKELGGSKTEPLT